MAERLRAYLKHELFSYAIFPTKQEAPIAAFQRILWHNDQQLYSDICRISPVGSAEVWTTTYNQPQLA